MPTLDLVIHADNTRLYRPNNLTSHQVSIVLILVSAPPALVATFTVSSIGSLKGTSIQSRPSS